jgi:hypothetical protein
MNVASETFVGQRKSSQRRHFEFGVQGNWLGLNRRTCCSCSWRVRCLKICGWSRVHRPHWIDAQFLREFRTALPVYPLAFLALRVVPCWSKQDETPVKKFTGWSTFCCVDKCEKVDSSGDLKRVKTFLKEMDSAFSVDSYFPARTH